MHPYDPDAEWLIRQVVEEASEQGLALDEREIAALSRDVRDLDSLDRKSIVALNNLVVSLARQRMERVKAAGARSVKVRRRLRIPADWAIHYESVHEGQQPWLISSIMQNAILSNPASGESALWESR